MQGKAALLSLWVGTVVQTLQGTRGTLTLPRAFRSLDKVYDGGKGWAAFRLPSCLGRVIKMRVCSVLWESLFHISSSPSWLPPKAGGTVFSFPESKSQNRYHFRVTLGLEGQFGVELSCPLFQASKLTQRAHTAFRRGLTKTSQLRSRP